MALATASVANELSVTGFIFKPCTEFKMFEPSLLVSSGTCSLDETFVIKFDASEDNGKLLPESIGGNRFGDGPGTEDRSELVIVDGSEDRPMEGTSLPEMTAVEASEGKLLAEFGTFDGSTDVVMLFEFPSGNTD